MNQVPADIDMATGSEATPVPERFATAASPATRSLLLDSVWLQLAISCVVGFLFALLVMGRGPLNPKNTDWLGEDGACHYIGWELLRQDPHWHWPLTYSTHIGYPVGESTALVDINPWMAIAFKPFSSVLPEPFQYFGIEAILVYVLQFFIALRLFRLILGNNLWGVWIAAAFFLIAPPLTFRLKFHYTLSNHWLLLAALLVFFQAQQDSPNRNPTLHRIRADPRRRWIRYQSLYRVSHSSRNDCHRSQSGMEAEVQRQTRYWIPRASGGDLYLQCLCGWLHHCRRSRLWRTWLSCLFDEPVLTI